MASGLKCPVGVRPTRRFAARLVEVPESAHSCRKCTLFFLFVHLARSFERRFRLYLTFEAVDDALGGLALQLLIGLEEVLDLLQRMPIDVREVLDALPAPIFDWHADYLVIVLARIDHFHQRDGANSNEYAWRDREGGEHEHIDGVTIVPESLGDEAILDRIRRRRVVRPVKLDEPGLLINLVFVLRALRYLDDDVHLLFRARVDVV